jgi:hypothetical protein
MIDLFRLPSGVIRRIRAQTDKEERERLIARLAALDGDQPGPSLGVMSRRPGRGVATRASEDPLERLWKLPAASRDARSPGSGRR